MGEKIYREDAGRLLSLSMFRPDPDRVYGTLENLLSRNDTHVFLSLVSSKPVGFIAAERSGVGTASIRYISVDAKFQGRGIGKELVIWLFSEWKDLREFRAETDSSAVGFYRKCGFAIKSLGEKYPGVERFECVLVRIHQD